MNKSPRNKDEVLRYLGYRNQDMDKRMDGLIDECMEEMRGLIREKSIYRIFNIGRKEGETYLSETNLSLQGQDIKNHLRDSGRCILMAVTLGNRVDFKIRYYEKVDMTRALILDACATTAVEEICDAICEDLQGLVNKNKEGLTSRFSPGYGDLPIGMQKDFLSVLGADKAIGLTASSHSILIPRKSVTAIIGIVDMEKVDRHREALGPNKGNLEGTGENTCLSCKFYDSCLFRREDGVGCGAYRKT